MLTQEDRLYELQTVVSVMETIIMADKDFNGRQYSYVSYTWGLARSLFVSWRMADQIFFRSDPLCTMSRPVLGRIGMIGENLACQA